VPQTISKHSLKRLTSQRYSIAVSGLFYFLLILSGVKVAQALLITGLVVIQTACGSFIYLRWLKSEPTTRAECLGMGFAIGSLLFVLADQILLTTFASEFSWLVLLFCLWLVWILQKSKGESQTNEIREIDLKTFAAVFSGALLILAPEWFWTFPAGVVSLVFTGFLYRNNFKRSIIAVPIGIVAISVALFWSIQIRPSFWWQMSREQPFLETIATSVSKFGSFKNILATGFTINYHWLSYGWSGLLTKQTEADLFLIQTKVLPVALAIACALIIFALAKALQASDTAAFIALALLVTYETVPTWGWGFHLGQIHSSSNFFAQFLLIAFFVSFVRYFHDSLKQSPTLPAILLSAVLVTKSSHGLLILGALTSLLFLQIISRRSSKKTARLLLASFPLCVAIYFIYFIKTGMKSSLGYFTFVWEQQGELRDFANMKPWFTLAAIILVFGLGGYQFILTTFSIKKIFKELNPVATFSALFALVGFGATSFLDFSGDNSEQLYFLQAVSFLPIVVFVVELTKKEIRIYAYKSKYLFVFIIGFISGASLEFIPNLNSGSKIAISLRLFRSLVVLIPLGVSILIYLVVRQRKPKTVVLSISVLVLISFASTSFGIFSNNIVERQSRTYAERTRQKLSMDQLFANGSRDVGTWIRANSAESDIFASNFFCDDMKCSGDGWFEQSIGNTPHKFTPAGYGTYTGFRSWSVELALESQRQFLIQAYVNFWQYESPPDWLRERVDASVEFADSPSVQTFDYLKAKRVTWFVVDLESTTNRNWNEFATEMYSNDRFLVLKLRDT
jgi:hypothetical protein